MSKSTFFQNLFKTRQSKNPIPEVLDLIPYTEAIADPIVLDSIQLVLLQHSNKRISSSAVMLLLMELNKAGLITVQAIQFPGTVGYLYIIKRNLNGQ